MCIGNSITYFRVSENIPDSVKGHKYMFYLKKIYKKIKKL